MGYHKLIHRVSNVITLTIVHGVVVLGYRKIEQYGAKIVRREDVVDKSDGGTNLTMYLGTFLCTAPSLGSNSLYLLPTSSSA
jgi:hypothetical protein